MKERKRTGKIVKSRAGTSMVEVLVAFLVVMLMMALFSRAVTASIDLLQRSRGIIQRTESFNQQYYTKEARKDRQNVSAQLYLQADDGSYDPEKLKLFQGTLQQYTDANTKLTRYTIYTDAQNPDDE